MRCPFCQGRMVAGRVDLRRTGLGFVADLVTGDLASMPRYIYFHPEGGDDCDRVDHTRPAFRCRGCEAVVLAGTRAKPAGRKNREPEPQQEEGAAGPGPTTCPACGAAVGPGQSRCPGCDIALR